MFAKAIPYEIYDAQTNNAMTVVGASAKTLQFSVNNIRQWWQESGRADYP